MMVFYYFICICFLTVIFLITQIKAKQWQKLIIKAFCTF